MQSIVDNLVSNTFGVSLPLYCPELVLCTTIVLLLLVRMFDRLTLVLPPFVIALIGTGLALAAAAPVDGFASLGTLPSTELFTGMLVYDGVTVYLRLALLLFAVLMVLLCRLTDLTAKFDGQDIYVLMLGATLGMCIMASANHLMTLFLGVEMASVPSYVLVGLVRNNRRASEAALKYAVYGAGAAGMMLYGISLLAGLLGTAHLPTIGWQLAELDLPGLIAGGQDLGVLAALVLAGLLIGVGLAFKLSAFPFHFWCPDAFEGGTAEVAGFLSVASKAAALALLVRVVMATCLPIDTTAPVVAEQPTQLQVVTVSNPTAANNTAATTVADSEATDPLGPVRTYLTTLIAVVALVTCTFGNLAAYGQTNIKRMLAYSTIAHAGYMMMPVAALVTLTGEPSGAAQALTSLLVYLGVYLFMNLAAFSIVAFLRNATGSENIDDYAGMVRSAPAITVCMVVAMASLLGIPPMAGFLGKFAAFAVLAKVGTPLMLTLLVVAGLNTVVSLVYYWRVVRTMVLRPEPISRGPVEISLAPVSFVVLVTLPLFLLFIFPSALTDLAQAAASGVLP
ncbi:NADH-quinone oxidoreductase subunit N [Aeoliella mucimassa]|uniref:NADH-quinone oxidoreductase subunit N n=1 Tax=Aeoliella mucimassa TaxID=2527972 RepID=A0A518ARX7_9BACT|nr:NADH-quinone oxidoreductase subunit N [Aeoliella mucimassa]QDU57477.1 NADH-quinone oxidoreductase subunit N [Aeoliella mucimassa]